MNYQRRSFYRLKRKIFNLNPEQKLVVDSDEEIQIVRQRLKQVKKLTSKLRRAIRELDATQVENEHQKFFWTIQLEIRETEISHLSQLIQNEMDSRIEFLIQLNNLN